MRKHKDNNANLGGQSQVACMDGSVHCVLEEQSFVRASKSDLIVLGGLMK